MPTYDYRCDHCGHVFSVVQSFADEALRACPKCGKLPRRMVSMPSIVFKGSGWYKTDSRPKAAGESGSSSGKAGSDGAAKGDAAKSDPKKDTKSATSKDTKSDTKKDAPPAGGKTPSPSP